jgi:hypothetical protein
MVSPITTMSQIGNKKSHFAKRLDRITHGKPAPRSQNIGKVIVAQNSVIVSRLDVAPGASNMKTDVSANSTDPRPAMIQSTESTIHHVLFTFATFTPGGARPSG